MLASRHHSRLWRVSIAGIAAAGIGVALAAVGLGFWGFVVAAALSTAFVPFVVELPFGAPVSTRPVPEPRPVAEQESPVAERESPVAERESPVAEQESDVIDMRGDLIAALRNLEPRERSVFVLRYGKGLSVPQIARTFHGTVPAASIALQRASKQMAALGWSGPERLALAARLLRTIDLAELSIFEAAASGRNRKR